MSFRPEDGTSKPHTFQDLARGIRGRLQPLQAMQALGSHGTERSVHFGEMKVRCLEEKGGLSYRPPRGC